MKLSVLLTFTFLLFTLPKSVLAVDCAPSPGGDYTVSASCQFPGTINGVDQGTGTSNTAKITINSSVGLTVAAGQTIAFGRDAQNVGIKLNGTINIVNGGILKQSPIWMPSDGGDGSTYYPAATTQYTASADCGGYTCYRRNLMTSMSTTDCDANTTNVYQSVAGTASDNDQDGYTDTASASNCVGASTAVSGRTYYKDTAGSYTWLVDSQKLGTSDCSDSSANVYQNVASTATDGDQDGYYTGASGTNCVGASTTVSGRTYYKTTGGLYTWLATAGALGTSDCNDSSGTVWQNLTCYTDSDADGYGTGGGSSVCSGASCASGYASNSTDCNDASANVYQNVASTATDADQDGFYIGSLATNCVGTTTTVSSRTYYRATGGSYTWIVGSPTGGANAISSTADCYDSNALASPQGTWSTTDRGDGSFDYDCSGAAQAQYTNLGTGCLDIGPNTYFTDNNCSIYWGGGRMCTVGSATSASNCGQTGNWTNGSNYLYQGGEGCDLTNYRFSLNGTLACR